MPDITITLTSTQATRFSAALGKLINADRSAATLVQAREWVRRQVRAVCLRDEQRAEGSLADTRAETALTTEGW